MEFKIIIMKKAINVVLVMSLSLLLAHAADTSKVPELNGTTNIFSSWTGKTANLTVRSNSVPWNRSLLDHVPVRANDEALIIAAVTAIRANRELQRKCEKFVEFIPYSEAFHVRLGAASAAAPASRQK